MASEDNPPALTESIWLPNAEDMPPQGQMKVYNIHGKPDPKGSVIILSLGVQFIWARFQEKVKAGGVATLVVGNLFSKVLGPGNKVEAFVPASVLDGAATEWDMGANQPIFGDAVVELLSVERGFGAARIVCRNTYDGDLNIAAGIPTPIAIPAGPPG